ncbi:uncharacterized protein LOC121726043 [Aricia agestis]|uniref:uncharacterized protein LOC121726043 n=1 Tax=Aricia agestis TaxID=91739 RepID=UPI001C209C24|nr:uncharacterized protein LOC121726043 [Aricia agestis]
MSPVYFIFVVISSVAEHDEKMYMLVSPDQHTLTPRLEDFFWTGSGDGPPPPDLSEPLPSPVSPVVLTTTVLATVYLDSYPPQAVTDKTSGECISNCGDANPDSLEPDIPEDRRYWLLTVIQGSTPDSLQLRLARLYQKAFLRQQERHLGIIKSLDAPTPRKKHDVQSFIVNKEALSPINSHSSWTPVKYYDIQSSIVDLNDIAVNTHLANQKDTTTTFYKLDTDNLKDVEIFPLNNIAPEQIGPTKVNEDSWILLNPTVVVHKREVLPEEFIGDEEDVLSEDRNEDLIDIPLESDSSNETLLFKREIIKPEQQPPVQVHIQNITESSDTGSVQIVYVVLVGGRAVPAAVAARDMRLVRDAEVANELGAVVKTKAEPAFLKAAEGLEGEVAASGFHGTELWALIVGSIIAVLLLLVLFTLLCIARRKKTLKSATSLRAYRDELMREVERNQMRQINDEKDSKLISVVSPNKTRPSSVLLPIYRTGSASSSTTTSSGISEVATALKRRHKKPHALRMPQKKRVGTTDSLLEAAGVESSDSGQPSGPLTPTSYLSMPSVSAFPRGNAVEPLSKILEPVSVKHLDVESGSEDRIAVPRRQQAAQLVRLGSAAADPGVIGPRVWDLHCQRLASKPSSPAKSLGKDPNQTRMRQRFNELMDDAFSLFGSAGSGHSQDTYTVEKGSKGTRSEPLAQARNDNVRLPAAHAERGRSADTSRLGSSSEASTVRARTALYRAPARPPPTRAWGPASPHHSLPSAAPVVDTALVTAQGRLPPSDPALPLISAIKTEIQRVRDNAKHQ